MALDRGGELGRSYTTARCARRARRITATPALASSAMHPSATPRSGAGAVSGVRHRGRGEQAAGGENRRERPATEERAAGHGFPFVRGGHPISVPPLSDDLVTVRCDPATARDDTRPHQLAWHPSSHAIPRVPDPSRRRDVQRVGCRRAHVARGGLYRRRARCAAHGDHAGAPRSPHGVLRGVPRRQGLLERRDGRGCRSRSREGPSAPRRPGAGAAVSRPIGVRRVGSAARGGPARVRPRRGARPGPLRARRPPSAHSTICSAEIGRDVMRTP